MAETFLRPVITKLVDLLGNEVNSLRGVQKEVKSLRDELEIIQPFIRDAEAKSERGEVSDAAKVWLKQIREEADRIEDVIDQYLYHMEEHGHQSGFIGSLRRAGRSIKTLKLRHDLASEIRDNVESLRKVKERGQSFGLRPFEQGPSGAIANVEAPVDPRISSLFIEKDQLVGIELTSKELVQKMVEGPSMRLVISLIGEGGIGKTTLAKNVYEDEVVKGHFDCYAWITLSQSYDVEKILKTMKSLICPEIEQPPGEIGLIQELIKLLRQYLQTKRYVVVFDDVWKNDFWEVIKHSLPSNKRGSRIIVTTRNAIIANCFKETPCDLVQELKPWPPELAWELFCKKAFCFEFEGHCPLELEQLSREIISKCEGIPLVIAAVAGLLSTKEKVVLEWQKVLHHLTMEFGTNPQLTSISKILSFSYYDLPYHLKPCYLYFGIFPEDHLIYEENLCRLWIAEGFIKPKGDKILEQVAKEYLNELIHRNLVKFELQYGVDRMCHVHDLMHEIILTSAKELFFFQILDRNKTRLEGKSRRLSVFGATKGVLKNVGELKVRSVSVFDAKDLTKSFLVGLCENFKLLTVLNFKNAPLDKLPKAVGNLFQLKYLCLRGTNVKMLPKSIGKLHNLQTLDVSYTFVKELPVEINKLRNLRHLLSYQFNSNVEYGFDSHCGVRIKEGIGRLEELQTLARIDAFPSFVTELQMLRKLKCLNISKVTIEIGKALGDAIEKMDCVEELFLTSMNEDQILDLNFASSPPPLLRYLLLNCPLQQFPDWILELQNLQGLTLGSSRLITDPLRCLEGLPNLAYLDMYEAYTGDQLHFEEGGFRKLRQLGLRKLEGLEVLKIDRGALPLLEELRFGPSPLMKGMPSDIRHLENLKSVKIFEMPREFVVSLQPDGGLDYCKIQHLPSVTFFFKDKLRNYEIYKLGSSNLLQYLQEQAT